MPGMMEVTELVIKPVVIIIELMEILSVMEVMELVYVRVWLDGDVSL